MQIYDFRIKFVMVQGINMRMPPFKDMSYDELYSKKCMECVLANYERDLVAKKSSLAMDKNDILL